MTLLADVKHVAERLGQDVMLNSSEHRQLNAWGKHQCDFNLMHCCASPLISLTPPPQISKVFWTLFSYALKIVVVPSG